MTMPQLCPARPRGPERHALLVDGRVAVAVKLQGKHAGGRCMTLDETDWARVRLVIGERWNVARTGEREYVTAYGGKAGLMKTAGKGVTLARWLTWAEPNEVVGYRDCDPLNLTRGNLVTMGRGEFLEQYRERGAERLDRLSAISRAMLSPRRVAANGRPLNARPC